MNVRGNHDLVGIASEDFRVVRLWRGPAIHSYLPEVEMEQTSVRGAVLEWRRSHVRTPADRSMHSGALFMALPCLDEDRTTVPLTTVTKAQDAYPNPCLKTFIPQTVDLHVSSGHALREKAPGPSSNTINGSEQWLWISYEVCVINTPSGLHHKVSVS